MNNEDLDNLDNIETHENTVDSEEITASTSVGGNFIRNPPPGSHVIIHVDKFKTSKENLTKPATAKSDAIDFRIKKKDGTKSDCKYLLIDVNGLEYTITSWEVLGKLRAFVTRIGYDTKNPQARLGGQTVLINHVANALADPKARGKAYEIGLARDGKFFKLEGNPTTPSEIASAKWVEVKPLGESA